MKKKFLLYTATIILIASIVVFYQGINMTHIWSQMPKSDSGVYTINDMTFIDSDMVTLNGEWNYYPNALFGDISDPRKENSPIKITVPEKTPIPSLLGNDWKGYGTYQITLINNSEIQEYELCFISSMAEAYSVYIDGKEVLSNGIVGKEKENSIPKFKSYKINLKAHEKVKIDISVSNFYYQLNGLKRPVLLGTNQSITKLERFNCSKDFFITGMLIAFAAYFAMIFTRNRQNGASVLCIVYASIIAIFYTITSNEMIIYDLPFTVPYWLVDMMQYMLALTGGSVFIILVSDLYPEESSKFIKKISIKISIILMIINILVPRYFMARYFAIFGITTLVSFLYGIYVLVKANSNKRGGTIPILLGTSLLLGAIIFDLFYLFMMIFTPYGVMTSVALIFFILSFAVVIAQQYEKAFIDVKNLSEQLIEINIVKDRFLANTSHELRTPINSIIALSKNLNNVSDDDDIKTTARIIAESSTRLNHLIRDLLDFSAMKKGHLSLSKSSFDFNELIEHVIEQLNPLIIQDEIQLNWQPNYDITMVYADKYRLVQVIYNLIGNAIKFTPKKGTISIKLSNSNDLFVLEIQDNGIGISDSQLNSIFDYFEQGDSTITKNYEGLGLGLSISKEIIESHGGRIYAVQQQVGALFVVELPIIEQNTISEFESLIQYNSNQEELLELENAMMYDQGRSGVFVLDGHNEGLIIIVDDYYNNIVAIATALKPMGYTIKGYTNSFMGLQETLNNDQVVAVVLDYMMPKMSGVKFCSSVREHYSMLEKPILITTARSQIESLVDSYKSGANDFIFKPFETEEICARVETLIKLKLSEERAIEHEMGKLSAQINPHFVSNAMIAISECCYTDPEIAAETLLDFTEYLRYVFTYDFKEKTISLEKELEVVKNYLSLEKLRFGESLTTIIDLDDYSDVVIPPFAIQTIVENAIRHGLRKKEGNGIVEIIGRKKRVGYEISVKDNGVGFNCEKLENIFSSLDYNTSSIGLNYVQKSMKKYFGTIVKIESIINEGAKVSLVIPNNNLKHADN